MSLGGCISRELRERVDNPPAVVETVSVQELGLKGEEASWSMFAEPISPSVLVYYPHLQHHTGEILLGNDLIQVVLAGVTSILTAHQWQAAILNVFIKNEGQWQALQSGAPIDMELSDAGARHWVKTGIDTEHDGEKARVIFFLSHRSEEAVSFRLTYTLYKNSQRLEIDLSRQASARASATDFHLWQWRYTPVSSALILSGAGSEDGRPISSLTYYQDRDATSILAFQPFVHQKVPGGSILEFGRLKSDSRVNLYFGSVAMLPAELAALKYCQANPLLHAHIEVSACIDLYQPMTLHIHPPPFEKTPGPNRIILIKDAMLADLAVVPLKGTLGTNIHLGANVAYHVYELTGNGEKSLGKIRGRHYSDVTLILPRIDYGTIDLQQLDVKQTPAFLYLRGEQRSEGQSLVNYIMKQSDAIFPVSAHVAILKESPSNLVQLPVGKYDLELFRGDQGVICRYKLNVVKGGKQTPVCAAESFPERRSFDWQSPSSSALLSEAGIDPTKWEELLGAKIITRSVNESDGLLASEDVIYTLEVKDAFSGLALRLFALNKHIKSNWDEYRQKGRGTVLQMFTAFAREEEPGSFLELMCPSEFGANFEEYGKLVETLAPDAVQLYGCSTLGNKQIAMGLLGKLQRKRSEPLLVTNVAIGKNSNMMNNIVSRARMLEAGAINSNDARGLLARIRRGDFYLTSGGRLEVGPSSIRVDPKVNTIELSVNWGVSPGFQPTKVTVYSEDGVIARQEITSDCESPLTIILRSDKSPNKRLRIELNGVIPEVSLLEEPQELVLASSNFISIQ